ncbi:MAG: hypothetical protein U0271_01340 [Polyangiaceae bacterium]
MGRASEWAPFGGSDLRMFSIIVESELQSRGLDYRLGDGFVEVVSSEGRQGLGLGNLAQVCGAIPRGDWAEAIKKHFELVFNRADEEGALEEKIHDFELVRAMLRVRLYDVGFEDQLVRTIAPDLTAGVVFDLPSSMRSVSRAEADAWQRTDDELFEIALDNLALEEAPEETTVIGPEEVRMTVVEGASYYTTSRALRLVESAIPAHHPFGALVALPNRHVFFYHLIEDARVVFAANALVSLAREAFRRGPGSITDQIFWVSPGGEVVKLPCDEQGSTLVVAPPARFVKDVLDRVVSRPS